MEEFESKVLKITYEVCLDSEIAARDYIEQFRVKGMNEGYTVANAGYTYKCKKSKGEIVAEAWVCKCTAEYNTIWGEY